MRSITFDRANGLCGLIFVLAGAFFAIQSLRLQIGTAFRMGPGYFPLVLALILIALGAVILFHATRVEGEPIGKLAWRGMAFILVAPIFFGLTLRGLGFVPALFGTALIAGSASTRLRLVPALILAAALTLFTTLVFVRALELPFRLIGPWLSF